MTTDGTVIASIGAGKAFDAAGNGNATSTSIDNTVTWVGTYTLQYLAPLDQSTPSNVKINAGKNGRVIPVKINVYLDGTLQSSTQIAEGRLTIKIVGYACESSAAIDPLEEYADAGSSNAGTNMFRPSGSSWIYNLDTKAVGMTNNHCYRLDVYLDGVKISTEQFAVFKAVK